MKKNYHGLISGVCKIWESKILKRMRIVALLLLISITQTFALDSYAQNKRLNLDFKNETIVNILENIEDQSEFYFMFDASRINVNQRKSVACENQLIRNILDQLFEDTGITYSINDRQVLLTTINKFDNEQQKAVSGKVSDSSGSPLPGVTVVIKGTSQGTVTNAKGEYSLTNIPENAILQFSFVGMKTQDVSPKGKTTINVTMVEDAIGIEEVVAIGYGVTKKSDLTGAISSVNADDLENVGITSVAHALSGKAAGLMVTQNSAQPGGAISWQIRGSASGREPLIIVDGFPKSGGLSSGFKASGLNSINPNDIESIEVLKDASACAIYGARAAGGVIIITTKRGTEGKVTVDYRGSYSTQKLVNMTEMLSPKDFMFVRNDVKKELFMRNNQVYPYGTNGWDDVSGGYEPYYSDSEIENFIGGTDWFDEVSRRGIIKQHNVTITSGTESSKYLISLSAFDQDGVIKANKFGRYTGRINVDQVLTKWLKTGISSSFSIINEDNVTLASGEYTNAGIIRAAMGYNPTLDIKDESGNYILDPSQSFVPNPVSLLENDNLTKNEDLFVNSFLEATPLDGLIMKLSAGYTRNWDFNNIYMPTSTLWGASEGGSASRSYAGKQDYLMNFIVNYQKKVGDNHNFNLMAGYEYQKFVWEGFNASNTQFPYDGVKWYNLVLGEREKPIVGSYGGSSEMASYITRLNYSYKDKVLLTANLRVDGSSNFAENNQWGVFPGVSVAWRIYQEPFLQDVGWISNLKLRLSYGQTGNDNLTGVQTYYSPGWNYDFGSVSRSGIGLANLGNPNLKWETQTDVNIGIDFGFLNNRITGTLELYDRVISDLLGDKSLLSYQAITSIKSNLDAEKQSRGIDLQISSININNDNFYWDTDMTFTYYRDRWKKRDASWKPDINDEEQAVWGAMWTYLSDGLVGINEEVAHMPGTIPGTVKLKDVNGYLVDDSGARILDKNGKPQYSGGPDGKIDKADLVNKGYNVPIPIGLNNSFRYRNFDLNVFFHAMFNRWAINEDRAYYGGNSFKIKDGANLMEEEKDNRWTYYNQEGTLPSIFQADSPYSSGDYFLEKAWFVRLKNITLGYSFPKHIIPNGIDKFRLFIDAQNLFVMSPFSGFDPETGSDINYPHYPNQRTITMGVEIKF